MLTAKPARNSSKFGPIFSFNDQSNRSNPATLKKKPPPHPWGHGSSQMNPWGGGKQGTFKGRMGVAIWPKDAHKKTEAFRYPERICVTMSARTEVGKRHYASNTPVSSDGNPLEPNSFSQRKQSTCTSKAKKKIRIYQNKTELQK